MTPLKAPVLVVDTQWILCVSPTLQSSKQAVVWDGVVFLKMKPILENKFSVFSPEFHRLVCQFPRARCSDSSVPLPN